MYIFITLSVNFNFQLKIQLFENDHTIFCMLFTKQTDEMTIHVILVEWSENKLWEKSG